MNQVTDPRRKNRRTGLLLGGLVAGMFGFGFAMVPLYNLVCKAAGVQSVEARNAIGPIAEAGAVVEDRSVTVKFDTNVHPELPWEFRVRDNRMEVHPGQMYEVMFEVTNRSGRPIVGQAIPAVIPWDASPFFTKLECFCFRQQNLAPGETKEMPLRFRVMPELPEQINSLTLSYIFMNAGAATAQVDQR
jgi:cytochrome c oxidase assembly protein subunit 11